MNIGAVFISELNQCVLPRVWRAVTTAERMRGLLGRPKLALGEGLLIDACNMVHTVGMTYDLDLVFLDANGVICKMVHDVRPMRFRAAFSAKVTLELPAGELTPLGLKLGQQLHWRVF